MEFTNELIIEIISTYGLAVLLVLYFVFIREPKKEKFWENQYSKLAENYEELSNNYRKLEESLKPHSRMCSIEQARNLADIGLDRDLYKLYYRMCEKIEGRSRDTIRSFIDDSIRITRNVWSKFKSPFIKVPYIGDLYGVYSIKDKNLEDNLQEIYDNDKLTNDEKKTNIWTKLRQDTIDMKNDFDGFLSKLEMGGEIISYTERKVREKK